MRTLWLHLMTVGVGFLTMPAAHANQTPCELQAPIIAAIDRAKDATVALHLNGGTGSGVLVSPDGLILSVAHVTGQTGQRAAVYFADGSVAAAETLGLEHGTDCGMLRMLGEGPWPYLPMADDRQARAADGEETLHRLAAGHPVIALGHPGGFDPDRPVVARLGHVLAYAENEQDEPWAGGAIRTDATLSAGDSGGPLLNPKAEVVGIHARVGLRLDQNFHVPVARFREQWDRLLEGGRSPAVLGVLGRDTLAGFRVGALTPGSPAERVNLSPGDVLTHFNGVALASGTDGRTLRSCLALRRPGDRVEVRTIRRGQAFTVHLELAEPAPAQSTRQP